MALLRKMIKGVYRLPLRGLEGFLVSLLGLQRRTWRKIHLGICGHSQEIVLSLLTENSVSDAEGGEEMAKAVATRSFESLVLIGLLLRKEELCFTTLSGNR
jgi:hypothetical protein